jgi:predicted NUDIX family phosphoesterase
MTPELVFCVGAHWARLKFRGEWTPHADVGDDIFRALSVYGFYAPRTDELERDDAIKQVITYAIVESSAFPGFVLGYDRRGAESRLHGRISVGIGGHLTADDRPHEGFGGILRGVFREVTEEIGPTHIREAPQVLGWINDDGDPVGRVHVGMVIRLRLSVDEPIVSTEIKHFGWFRPADVRAMEPGRLERWSQILVDCGVIG